MGHTEILAGKMAEVCPKHSMALKTYTYIAFGTLRWFSGLARMVTDSLLLTCRWRNGDQTPDPPTTKGKTTKVGKEGDASKDEGKGQLTQGGSADAVTASRDTPTSLKGQSQAGSIHQRTTTSKR